MERLLRRDYLCAALKLRACRVSVNRDADWNLEMELASTMSARVQCRNSSSPLLFRSTVRAFTDEQLHDRETSTIRILDFRSVRQSPAKRVLETESRARTHRSEQQPPNSQEGKHLGGNCRELRSVDRNKTNGERDQPTQTGGGTKREPAE